MLRRELLVIGMRESKLGEFWLVEIMIDGHDWKRCDDGSDGKTKEG